MYLLDLDRHHSVVGHTLRKRHSARLQNEILTSRTLPVAFAAIIVEARCSDFFFAGVPVPVIIGIVDAALLVVIIWICWERWGRRRSWNWSRRWSRRWRRRWSRRWSWRRSWRGSWCRCWCRYLLDLDR